MANYFDKWKEGWTKAQYTCKCCGWSGKGAELTEGDWNWQALNLDCPKCFTTVAAVLWPTWAEVKANLDTLPEADRQAIERREQRDKEFSETALIDPSQLPDIEGTQPFVLTWDREGEEPGYTTIRYGPRLIWKETAWYECYERFRQVAEILKRKYGERIQDLVPLSTSFIYLYGDRPGSLGHVEQTRKLLEWSPRGREGNVS